MGKAKSNAAGGNGASGASTITSAWRVVSPPMVSVRRRMTPGGAIDDELEAVVRPVAGQLDRARVVRGQDERLAADASVVPPM